MDNFIIFSAILLPVLMVVTIIITIDNGKKIYNRNINVTEAAINSVTEKLDNYSEPINEEDPIKMGEVISKSSFLSLMRKNIHTNYEGLHG